MYTATQASMLHRWNLNLNTCKKCMLRYWKIPHLTSLNLERVISLFSPQISLRRNTRSLVTVALPYTGKMSIRSTRTYVKKSWNAIIKTHTCTHTHIRFHVIMITTSSMSENTKERMPRERPDFGWNWSFSQNSMGRRCWSLYK